MKYTVSISFSLILFFTLLTDSHEIQAQDWIGPTPMDMAISHAEAFGPRLYSDVYKNLAKGSKGRPVPYDTDSNVSLKIGKKLIAELNGVNHYSGLKIRNQRYIELFKGNYEGYAELYGFEKFDVAASSAMFYGFAWAIANNKPFLEKDQMNTLYLATIHSMLENSDLESDHARQILDETMMLEMVLMGVGLGGVSDDPVKKAAYSDRVASVIKERFGIDLRKLSVTANGIATKK